MEYPWIRCKSKIPDFERGRRGATTHRQRAVSARGVWHNTPQGGAIEGNAA
jgi:hypothetical protein